MWGPRQAMRSRGRGPGSRPTFSSAQSSSPLYQPSSPSALPGSLFSDDESNDDNSSYSACDRNLELIKKAFKGAPHSQEKVFFMDNEHNSVFLESGDYIFLELYSQCAKHNVFVLAKRKQGVDLSFHPDDYDCKLIEKFEDDSQALWIVKNKLGHSVDDKNVPDNYKRYLSCLCDPLFDHMNVTELESQSQHRSSSESTDFPKPPGSQFGDSKDDLPPDQPSSANPCSFFSKGILVASAVVAAAAACLLL